MERMSTNRRGNGLKGAAWALALLWVLAPMSAGAQPNPFGDQAAEKSETKIGDFERKQVERRTLADEEGGSGPRLEFETEQKDVARDKLQHQESAIKKIKMRIDGTDDDDPDKPLLMERLSDMLWQRARFHELRSFDRLMEAREFEAAGNASKAAEMMRLKEEDEKTAAESREEMLKNYKEVIKYFPDYPQIDKIKYYLAFNLAEMGYAAEAYEHYMSIVRDHSNSQYIGDAFLGLAEYTFNIEEDMVLALSQYQKTVEANPNSQAGTYAMYKMGWCYFNLGEPRKALAQFEKVIDFAGRTEGRMDIRKEAVRDLVKAYSMWAEARPSNAKKYFSKFAGDANELREMLERLARMYQEDGELDASTYIYNELIKDNINDYRIVGYQIEIMFNVESRSDPEKTAQEIMRTVILFKKAMDAGLEGATPEKIKENYDMLEEYTRETAKWYHITAQTTKNPLYYALAYEIYRAYVENFPEAADNYEMLYYYAELLYGRKNYAEAAKRYDQVIDLNPDGEFSRDAAYGSVLSYTKLAAEPGPDCPPVPDPPPTPPGEEPTFPELPIAECRLRLIKASHRYAAIVDDAEYLVDIKYTTAKIYYDHNHLDAAIPLFQDVAMSHSEHRLAVFSANLLLDCYNIKKDYQAMWEWVRKFRANEHLNQPPLDEKLENFEVQLAFKFCMDTEKEKDWVAAATCYEDFATNYSTSEFAAKSLWNASVDWENASEIGKAIEARIRLLREHGSDPDLAPRALYAIGQNFHGIAVYSEAARFYEMFVDRYPQNRTACVAIGETSDVSCAMLALQNAAAFRSGLGEYKKAVANYDLYIKLFPRDQEQLSLLKFNTGRIYFDQGLYDEAIARYDEYLSRYAKAGPQSRQVAAHTAIGRSYWRSQRQAQALKSFERAETLFNSKGFQKWFEGASAEHQKEAMEAAAEARFMRGEFEFNRALAVQLTDESVPERRMEAHLQGQLKKKAELMRGAEPIYVEVIVRFGAFSPRWGLAAMSRLGMMYHDVAEQIEKAPVPKRLTEDQALIYEDVLLDFAGQFEEKAIDFYVTAVEKAAELGWFSEYTMSAQRRLFDLRPQEYRSASEIKAQPNKATVNWHMAQVYDDVEEIMGNKAKKRRGSIDLESDEMELSDSAANAVENIP